MLDVFPVDYTSDIGRIRKYVPDVLPLDDPKDPFAEPSYMWSDDALQSFLDDERPAGVDPIPRTAIWRAAASVMIATANNENLILKKLTTDDLATDGPAVSKALLASAQELMARAKAEEYLGSREETFTVVPYPADDSYTRRISRTVWGL